MKMIVCVDEKYGIGKNGDLLFSLPPDMKFFREETLGKTVIMGRSTLDSFPGGRALKNRTNIVLTRNCNFERENVIVFNTKEAVLEYTEKQNTDDVYVIGGAEIYSLFEPYCNEAFVTKVQKDGNADKFFFNIDNSPEWKLDKESETLEHEGIKFTFCKYIR